MNCRLNDVDVTSRDGKLYTLNQVYLRGSQIRFIVIPDMLAKSPIIQRVNAQAKRGKHGGIPVAKACKLSMMVAAPPKRPNLRPPAYN